LSGIQQHGKAAVDAVAAELIQLFRTKGALVPVLREDLEPSERRKIIRSSMFLKEKYSAQGIFEKIKARLVADGSTQDRELYPDNNSPTVAVPHLMTMLVVAAKEKRHVMKIDIGGAYLNAEMVGESVIMEINKEVTGIIREVLPEIAPFVRDGKLLVKLKKALYGCIQSAKLWYLKLQSVLERMRRASLKRRKLLPPPYLSIGTAGGELGGGGPLALMCLRESLLVMRWINALTLNGTRMRFQY
jgi:hypothetical protein